MNGLKGICPACGASYYGWALANPAEQRCGKCGSALEIRRDSTPAAPGSSLVSADLRDVVSNTHFYLRRN